jgi:hypothetical protein
MTPRVRAFWIGVAVAVVTVVEWEIDDFTPYPEPPWVKVLAWLTIPILVGVLVRSRLGGAAPPEDGCCRVAFASSGTALGGV